jgi:Hypoxia induced protein conserved region
MGKVVVAVALAVVVVILCLGLFTLYKGGETSRSWSNRLMRMRVVAQFVAILIILAVLYLSQNH